MAIVLREIVPGPTSRANLPVPAGDPNLPVQNRANLQLGSGALPRGNLRNLAAQNTKIG
jgi:hypothetical protein